MRAAMFDIIRRALTETCRERGRQHRRRDDGHVRPTFGCHAGERRDPARRTGPQPSPSARPTPRPTGGAARRRSAHRRRWPALRHGHRDRRPAVRSGRRGPDPGVRHAAWPRRRPGRVPLRADRVARPQGRRRSGRHPCPPVAGQPTAIGGRDPARVGGQRDAAGPAPGHPPPPSRPADRPRERADGAGGGDRAPPIGVGDRRRRDREDPARSRRGPGSRLRRSTTVPASSTWHPSNAQVSSSRPSRGEPERSMRLRRPPDVSSWRTTSSPRCAVASSCSSSTTAST